jgi:hypothetical protein
MERGAMYTDMDRYRATLRAYAGLLHATVAYARYLRRRGRLRDADSDVDIAALEAEEERIRRLLDRLAGHDAGPELRLPLDPPRRLAFAARRQLRAYQTDVCADARRLRARSRVLRGITEDAG